MRRSQRTQEHRSKERSRKRLGVNNPTTRTALSTMCTEYVRMRVRGEGEAHAIWMIKAIYQFLKFTPVTESCLVWGYHLYNHGYFTILN